MIPGPNLEAPHPVVSPGMSLQGDLLASSSNWSSPPPPANMSAPHRRGPWATGEDKFLMRLVNRHGPLNWVKIANTIGSRTPKQCRERYHQNLKPTLNHQPITAEEGRKIEELVQQIGKRWAEIARRLHGRSDNAVKNWWNGSQNRRKRMDRRRAVHVYDGYNGQVHPTSPSGFPPVQPQPTLQLNQVQRHPMQWVDAPLPSPCASEDPESEMGSNYTTSPDRHLARPAFELPPLRGHPQATYEPRLPSIQPLASPQPRYVERYNPQPRLPPMGSQTQLLTAPNSPQYPQFQMQQTREYQAQEHQAQEPQTPRDQTQSQAQSQKTKKPRDSRMNLNSLLD